MSIRRHWSFAIATLAGTLTLSSGRPARALAQSAAPRPTLVVFLTVDQMRPDYFDRWAGQLTGGLARLSKQGAFFTNAYQDHAVTETAPGHSVTMSGRFPRSTGILRNAVGVEDPQAPLITSRDPGASPFRFRGSTLIDWMRLSDARSRALSISRKDRGAILPLGRAKQSVFWYATSNGEFTTSRYYADTLPTWIRRVNARRVPQRLAGQSWTLLLPVSQYAEPDSVAQEYAGHEFTFPHLFPSDTVGSSAALTSTPWMDRLTLDVALEGLQALNLGRGTQTDLLAVSLSATDYIGHRYGPDSREQHDNILRLDRSLGAFIDSLYRLRDSSTIVFALTADHGVTSFPELVAQRARRAALPRYDLGPPAEALRSMLRQVGVDSAAVSFDGTLVIVNRAAFARAHVNPDPLLARFADALRRRPGVARVDHMRDLARRDTVRDAVSRRWQHMIPPDAPVEYVVTPVQGAYPAGATIAEHGSPYDDDAHVPVIFYGPGIRAGRVTERALVADMAPTLARIIGVTPIERLDGRVLQRALPGAAPR
ncbi:MAG: alkaline phosphatase family protein [Gemmatimonadaceae bacterium]